MRWNVEASGRARLTASEGEAPDGERAQEGAIRSVTGAAIKDVILAALDHGSETVACQINKAILMIPRTSPAGCR
jgi:hypothetical protein